MSSLNLPVNPDNIVVFECQNLIFSFDNLLANVSRKKNIIKTEIQGSDGTVKEITGQDDFQISFTGTITGTNGSYPSSEVVALKKILDLKDTRIPIDVTGSFLNNLGIYSIIIEDYKLPQEAGGYSYQSFTIEAISDEPIVIQIG